MTLPDFLHRGSFGEIRFAGSRIDLYHVVECYNRGFSAEQIALEYDTVTLANIHKAIAYYLENTAAVDAYRATVRASADERRARGQHPDWEALRQRVRAPQPAAAVPPGSGD
jgi:uncharacterized protein (DUF433 family)